MLKIAALLMAVALGGALWPLGLERIERALVYPFDATSADPGALGLKLEQRQFESGGHRLVLWVAPARPGQPVILYFHGNAGNLAARAGRFRRFLARGYGLVALGYRGSSGSGGTPSEAALSYDAGRLLTRIGSYGGTAPVVIYGESLGAAVALAAVSRAGIQPAAVILEAPFTTVRDVARHAHPELDGLIGRMKSEWNSLARIADLRAPLLIVHGSDDALIPTDMGRQLFAAAPSNRKTLLVVPGGHHTDLWRSDVLPRVWRFIARHGAP